MRRLMNYDWPGNVRELENCLERAFTLSSGPVLQVIDLPGHMQRDPDPAAAEVPHQPLARLAEESNVVPIARLEKEAILSTLDKLKGDRLLTAKLLGIGKMALYR